jgi:hypothetical protein
MKIYDFNQFVKMNEDNSAGYGDQAFFFVKDGDQHCYMFKLKDGREKDRGFVITIGNFSRFSQPAEAKNAYGVISIVELSISELDQAVADKGIFDSNEKRIDADETAMNKIMQTLTLIVTDYLQNMPKVNKLYDEMQANLHSTLYQDKIKGSVTEWPGEWKFQEIENGKLNLIMK